MNEMIEKNKMTENTKSVLSTLLVLGHLQGGYRIWHHFQHRLNYLMQFSRKELFWLPVVQEKL